MLDIKELEGKIINSDCMDILKQLPDDSIDLLVTDPPYRTISGGRDENSNWWKGSVLEKNDGKIFKENDVNHKEWIGLVYKKMKDQSHAYIMTNLLNLFELKEIAESVGFVLHNLLVWEKNNAVFNKWYMKNCEYTLFLRKGKAKFINDLSSKTVECFENPVNKLHPTEKPIGLMERYILNSSNNGDIILDPFSGSGTTAIACHRLKRRFICIEKDPEYWAKSCERLKHEQAQLQLF